MLQATARCALVLALAACGDLGSDASSDQQALQVFAAASLAGSFDELAERFETSHQGVRVEAVYDSSATLATQVTEGAPADVLATADLDTVQDVVDAGDAESFETFAGNTAVLVTPKDDPAGITSFADLDAKPVDYVVCVDTAPCGRVAASLLRSNGVETEPRSYEDNVKAVLEKVTSGEVDAGIVYVTDARAEGGNVRTIEILGAADHVTEYGIAVIEHSDNTELARAFVDLVLSDEGQRVLRAAGFAEAP